MAISLDSGFEIIFFSDLTYEEITTEVQYKGESIAQLNKDKGFDKIEIELFTDYAQADFVLRFMLSDFLDALDKAKKLLEVS